VTIREQIVKIVADIRDVPANMITEDTTAYDDRMSGSRFVELSKNLLKTFGKIPEPLYGKTVRELVDFYSN
jgi:hypothetical protein